MAFCGQEKLTTVTIPSSVAIIDDYAFTNCTNLRQIELNEGLKEMGMGIFRYDEKITEIILPNSLETIKGYLYGYDYESIFKNNLKKLICKSNIPPIITDVDEWRKSVKSVSKTELYVPMGTKEIYLNEDGWSSFESDRITELDGAFVFLDLKSAEMLKGQTIPIKRTYIYDPNNISYIPARVGWESSNETVAIAEDGMDSEGNQIGLINALNPGEAIITFVVYPIDTKKNPVSASCYVTVKEGAVSFSLSETDIALGLNETKQLIIDLTGLEEGKSKLTVTMINENGNEISETCEITVVKTISDVATLFVDNEDTSVNIYNLNGTLIKSNVRPESVVELPKGIYIVGDKKVLVK